MKSKSIFGAMENVKKCAREQGAESVEIYAVFKGKKWSEIYDWKY